MSSSTFIYSVVARSKVVLAEYSDPNTFKGNFIVVSRLILEKLDSSTDVKKVYTYDQYMVHIVVSSGIIYMCITESLQSGSIMRVMNFLEEIQKRFTQTYDNRKITNAAAYEMNDEFARVLQSQMQYWSSSIANDRSAALATKIEGVKGILMENIEKLMDREEKIGLLVEKTSEMQTQSFAFSTKSTELKRKLCWRNFRLYIVIAVLLMVLGWLIASSICGFDFSKCSGDGENPPPRSSAATLYGSITALAVSVVSLLF
jgi:vesicle-associated membrane protein 7